MVLLTWLVCRSPIITRDNITVNRGIVALTTINKNTKAVNKENHQSSSVQFFHTWRIVFNKRNTINNPWWIYIASKILDAPPPPPPIQFSSFSSSFQEISFWIIGWHRPHPAPLAIGAPFWEIMDPPLTVSNLLFSRLLLFSNNIILLASCGCLCCMVMCCADAI